MCLCCERVGVGTFQKVSPVNSSYGAHNFATCYGCVVIVVFIQKIIESVRKKKYIKLNKKHATICSTRQFVFP